MSPRTNRFAGHLGRRELLEELRSYKDDNGLDRTATFDGEDVGDPKLLSDDELRELLKMARWRALLWSELDE